MKRSPKLPAFGGRCRARHLTDAAALAAGKALEKAAFAPASRWADTGHALASLALLLVLLLSGGASGCAAQRPTRTEADARRAELPAPRYESRYEWHEANTTTL